MSPLSPPQYLRLQPHPFSILPDHVSLRHSPSRPPLRDFLHVILTEAQSFVTAIPTTFHPTRKPRPSPPAAALVHLSTCSLPDVPSGVGTKKKPGSNFWICRTSVHENAAHDGTASWAEFRAGLRESHSVHEMEYTPSVSAVETLLEWPTQTEIEGGWQRVIVHAPRSFIVLVVSADRPGGDQSGFMTVQIPLSPEAEPADALPDLCRAISAAQPSKAVLASYSSVEQVSPTRSDAVTDAVTWTMATTSEAGGAIPGWVQRSWTLGGAPKAVVADVGLFLGWTSRKRSSRGTCLHEDHSQAAERRL
ncbi:SRPBCC family protein [Aspergillus homomorphus CBS 101889]|uniref:DUF3074 domain-containing protein n=1 Tax=Aspergillus homomorphus (strain CBS 101889) TaxID=1450537 RepID=A0A395I790_ASPHC|nr:hypothetical protein BO97DRAFT_363490 [Aspergillus homomorphus CBS 101889]RAL15669.1 hypothetical protein BO97DRAFT_363490 [Aspergillus homomorphus CBS 101889]